MGPYRPLRRGYRGRVASLKGDVWTKEEAPIWAQRLGPIQNPVNEMLAMSWIELVRDPTWRLVGLNSYLHLDLEPLVSEVTSTRPVKETISKVVSPVISTIKSHEPPSKGTRYIESLPEQP